MASRAASIVRPLARALAGLLLLLVAALAGARLWLETDSGSAWLARRVSALASERLPFRVEVRTVDWRGLAQATAHGLSLRGPEGRLVASADSAALSLDRIDLPGRRVVVGSLEVDGLAADVVGAGPSAPASAEPVDAGSSWSVEVRQATLSIAGASWASKPGTNPEFRSAQGEATGSLRLAQGALAFSFALSLDLLEPVRGPARLRAAGRWADDRLALERLEGTLPGGIRLEGSGSLAAGGAGSTGPAPAPRAPSR